LKIENILFLFSLSRVWNALFAAAVCAYSFFIVNNNFETDYCNIGFFSLGIFFLVAFANAHNDITDFEIDKINRSKRPLPSGKISIKAAYKISGILFLAAIVFSALAGIKYAPLFFIVGTLSVIYNRFLKGLPLVGNFTVALLTTTPIIIPIIKFGLPQPKLSTLVFFAFMLTFVREITKDIEDMEGDKSQNLKTLPLLIGANLSLALIFICELQCLIHLALFNLFLLAGVAPFIVLSAIFAVLKKWRISQNMIKLAMVGGLIIFYLISHAKP
jgi:4-hydroxybenzoate polyprenyltransferase